MPAMPVMGRHVHDEGRGRLAAFVDLQGDTRRDGGLAARQRPRHGFPAHGVLPHVEADRLDIKAFMRLHIDIHRIAIALASRPDREVRKPHGALPDFDRRPLRRCKGLGIGQRHDRRIVVLQFERSDVILPFAACHVFARLEQGRAAFHDRLVVVEAIAQQAVDISNAYLELGLQALILKHNQPAPGNEGDQQRRDQHHPGKPDAGRSCLAARWRSCVRFLEGKLGWHCCAISARLMTFRIFRQQV